MDIAAVIEWIVRVPVFLAAFVFVLSTVVVFHEFGHFAVARLSGVKVDVFSLGFGKALASFRDPWGVEWRLSAIPLGGYVKFWGDANAASMPKDEADEPDDDDEGGGVGTQFPHPTTDDVLSPEERRRAFHHKPVWIRALIVAAGPIANFVLAMIIFTAVLMSFGKREILPIVQTVQEESAAERAGLLPGDEIIAVDGRAISTFNDVRMIVYLSSGDELILTVKRGDDVIDLPATPDRREVTDGLGNTVKAGFLGFTSDPRVNREVKYGFVDALGGAAAQIGDVVGTTYRYLKRLIVGKEDASQLGGPVRILKYSGQVAEQSYEGGENPGSGLRAAVINLINLAGFLSVSVGLLNLLPIPVLDGGHLLFYAFEAAGAPLGPKTQAFGFRLGMVVLAAFFVFVTFNDLTDLFAGVAAR
ncbi:MAG: RIP metalloprotease [Pseudomonadota bacterium]